MNYSREEALNSLRYRVKDAKSLVICDPYILSSKRGVEDVKYVRELLSIMPKSLAKLVLVTSEGKITNTTRKALMTECQEQIQILTFTCSTIHDRIWIVNISKAFATGTSFNSIGYSLSFINDLPKEDFENFWHFLTQELGNEFEKVLFEQ